MQTAAAYLRVSTDEQVEQGISLPAQKSRLLAYCQAQGWTLYDYYMDDGFSGKNLERPAMQKLIEDAQDKKFNAVIVIKLDRLSRRQKDVLYLLEDILEPNCIGFKSVTEPFDTTTPFGKAAIGMMAVFAQLERETIIERVKMAKIEAAKQGRFGGGGVPFGFSYSSDKKLLEIDARYASVVRLIYALYASGIYGIRTLADELNRRKISAPCAAFWYKDTVKKILSNPFYAGYVHRRGEIHPGQHAPIIPIDEWTAIQKRLGERYAPRPSRDPENLLTGFLYCGNCGARMRFKTQKWKDKKNPDKIWLRKYYICYSQMGYDRMSKDPHCKLGFKKVEEINGQVIAQLKQITPDPSLINTMITEALHKRYNKSTAERELDIAKKELQALSRKIERWNSAFENGAIEVEELATKTKELRKKRTAVESMISELKLNLQSVSDNTISVNEIVEKLKRFHQLWAHASDEERQAIIAGLINKVVLFPDNHIEIEPTLI